jgi:phosphatidylserine/phosphatidylglycerophosphate/cardiolipin synthase-like enzyme
VLVHSDGRLLDAGAALWEYPTIMHAKVLVADDITIVGAINLDAWALYRNHEIALRCESRALGDQVQRQWVAPDIARSAPGQQPTGAWPRFRNWVWAALASFV